MCRIAPPGIWRSSRSRCFSLASLCCLTARGIPHRNRRSCADRSIGSSSNGSTVCVLSRQQLERLRKLYEGDAWLLRQLANRLRGDVRGGGSARAADVDAEARQHLGFGVSRDARELYEHPQRPPTALAGVVERGDQRRIE